MTGQAAALLFVAPMVVPIALVACWNLVKSLIQ